MNNFYHKCFGVFSAFIFEHLLGPDMADEKISEEGIEQIEVSLGIARVTILK